MKIKKTLITFILILIYHCSCKNKSAQSIDTSKAVLLNDQGSVFFNEYLYYNGNKTLLDSAIFYFNAAIATDENNLVARQNKIAVLYEQNKYDEVISNLNVLIEKTETDDYQTKAMLYKSLAYPYHLKGDFITEQSILLRAKQCYQQGLKESLEEGFVFDYLLFTAYNEGRDMALLELEKYKDVFQYIRYEEVKEYLLFGDFDYRESFKKM